MSEHFVPELGQYAFSNSAMQSLSLSGEVEDGLCVIARAIMVARGEGDAFGSLVSNSGGVPYESSVFAMRAYCWCDGDVEGHDEGCPPNFEHHASDFAVSWYKHVGRSGSMNRPIEGREWFAILRDCLADVLDQS